MQPGSLVFIAIIATWAAYLLPQWVRRRDAMGQSRSRDRDSSALRVLRPRRHTATGRSTVPLLGDGGHDDPCALDAVIRPDSPQAVARREAAGRPDAAVYPEVDGHPEVDGRPEVRGHPEVRGRPEVARCSGVSTGLDGGTGSRATGEETRAGANGGPDAVTGTGDIDAPPARGLLRESGPGREPTHSPVAGEPPVSTPGASRPGGARSAVSNPPERRVTPGRRGEPAMSRARRVAAIRRARTLAVLLISTVLSWLAVLLALLTPLIAWTVTALLAADLVALRTVARRRTRSGRAPVHVHGSGKAAVPVAASTGGGNGTPVATPAAKDGTPDAARRPALTPGAPLRRTLPPAAARRPAAHRVSRREAPAAEAGLPTADGTWMPIPVPPPTYTLKPMAPRPAPPALEQDGDRPAGPAGPGGATGAAKAVGDSGDASGGAVVVGAEGIAPSTGTVPDRYEGVEPPAAEAHPARRPWDDAHEWADDLDLDAVLARRRAVNG